jgi:hypothetical protein
MFEMDKKASVYRNLKNREGVGYSVQQKGRVRTGFGGVQKVLLEDCKFVVRPAGYRNTMAEVKPCGNPKKKYVHAFVVGNLTMATNYAWPMYSQTSEAKLSEEANLRDGTWEKARYNPKMGPYFTLDGRKLAGAQTVYLCATGIWVAGPIFQ